MKLFTATAFFCVCSVLLVCGQPSDTIDWLELDLDALMKVNVYSASKKVERTFESPLSTTVLTRQEIENAGITTVEEALRLIPG